MGNTSQQRELMWTKPQARESRVSGSERVHLVEFSRIHSSFLTSAVRLPTSGATDLRITDIHDFFQKKKFGLIWFNSRPPASVFPRSRPSPRHSVRTRERFDPLGSGRSDLVGTPGPLTHRSLGVTTARHDSISDFADTSRFGIARTAGASSLFRSPNSELRTPHSNGIGLRPPFFG
jgi:hypothetical protein